MTNFIFTKTLFWSCYYPHITNGKTGIEFGDLPKVLLIRDLAKVQTQTHTPPKKGSNFFVNTHKKKKQDADGSYSGVGGIQRSLIFAHVPSHFSYNEPAIHW